MAQAWVNIDTLAAEADRELAVNIRKVLLDYEPIRATRPPLEIDVQEGRVHLQGRMRTLAMKEIAEYKIMRLEGVRAVRNDVLTDPEVVRRVTDALASDAGLGPLCIQVDARYGNVVLAGRIPSGTAADRAMQIAATAPGVENVVNRMRIVAPSEPAAGRPAPSSTSEPAVTA
jgi:osmotically-inducible protein OsmY